MSFINKVKRVFLLESLSFKFLNFPVIKLWVNAVKRAENPFVDILNHAVGQIRRVFDDS